MVGLAVLLVLAVRLVWRLVDTPPAAERTRLGALADRVAGWAIGAVLALGGLAGIVAVLGWLFGWATAYAKPSDPTVDDEDEIDHRFY